MQKPEYIFACGLRVAECEYAYWNGHRRKVCPEHGGQCRLVNRAFVCDVCGKEVIKHIRAQVAGNHFCPECYKKRHAEQVKTYQREYYRHVRRKKNTGPKIPEMASFIPHDHWDDDEARPSVDPVNGRLPGCNGFVGVHDPLAIPMEGRTRCSQKWIRRY
jgi:hypothetical protein